MKYRKACTSIVITTIESHISPVGRCFTNNLVYAYMFSQYIETNVSLSFYRNLLQML